MLLSSVLLTSSPCDEDDGLPPIIEQNIESMKAMHPGLDHRLFVHEDVVALLEDKFPRSVLDAYLAMRPFAYRADLARYCILYEFGGLYADLSYFFVRPLPVSSERAVVFRGNLVSAPWDTSNGLIFAPPKHKALERAVELVCANVQRRYYGLNALCPTGPALFGKAVAATCEAEELITGSASLLPRKKVGQVVSDVSLPQSRFIHCQFLNNRLVAVKRKRPLAPGLTDFGVTTGNVYREFWKNKEVYS